MSRGWMTTESRKKAGRVWVYHFYKTRVSDGHRVENTVVLGPLSSFPKEKDAWSEVEHRHLDQNEKPEFRGRVTFGDVARHYIKYELSDPADAADQKSQDRRKVRPAKLPYLSVPRWQDLFAGGNSKHPTASRPTGFFRVLGSTASNPAWPICWWKIISVRLR
jgi:hypothetical protein